MRRALELLEKGIEVPIFSKKLIHDYNKSMMVIGYQKAILRGKINTVDLTKGTKEENRPFFSKMTFSQELKWLRDKYPVYIFTEYWRIPWKEGKDAFKQHFSPYVGWTSNPYK